MMTRKHLRTRLPIYTSTKDEPIPSFHADTVSQLPRWPQYDELWSLVRHHRICRLTELMLHELRGIERREQIDRQQGQ